MPLNLQIIPHTLNFRFAARTSRGAMQSHQIYYLKLNDTDNPQLFGVGECAPLPGLSPEYQIGFSEILEELVLDINNLLIDRDIDNLDSIIYASKYIKYPSLVFALETAWLDFVNGGQKQMYQNSFTAGSTGIPINGLIWMGDKSFMQEQIIEKLKSGYSCLKLKIGGLDFKTELEILQSIREVASASELTIRLDANGAFSPTEALQKLNQLAPYQIHSIEQPIRQGQQADMKGLCQDSPIAIALDEELIGISGIENKQVLLATIQPQYIILKPTLLGGLNSCAEWITLAEESNVGWWITSALESNIGLNAISQFTAQYPIKLEQGLGTGQLYHNNIDSPLTIRQGFLYYDKDRSWQDSIIQS